MDPTMGTTPPASDHGHTGAVDEALARAYGGRPATWHARRYGPHAVNLFAAAIIREWRGAGQLEELATWVTPIEEALAPGAPAGSHARLRAALADAAEDDAEARYDANPCEETARALLRKRATDRLASLDYDREIAARYGIGL